VADAGVAVAAGPLHGAGLVEAGEAGQQLLEHDAHLEAGQVGAEAEVDAPPEGEVRRWSNRIPPRKTSSSRLADASQ
jgi:hypothetical protein